MKSSSFIATRINSSKCALQQKQTCLNISSSCRRMRSSTWRRPDSSASRMRRWRSANTENAWMRRSSWKQYHFIEFCKLYFILYPTEGKNFIESKSCFMKTLQNLIFQEEKKRKFPDWTFTLSLMSSFERKSNMSPNDSPSNCPKPSSMKDS